MELIVFSKNFCGQCIGVKRFLEGRKVSFKEINIDKEPKHLDFLKERSISQMPAVFLGDEFVTGFRVPELNALIEKMNNEVA